MWKIFCGQDLDAKMVASYVLVIVMKGLGSFYICLSCMQIRLSCVVYHGQGDYRLFADLQRDALMTPFLC